MRWQWVPERWRGGDGAAAAGQGGRAGRSPRRNLGWVSVLCTSLKKVRRNFPEQEVEDRGASPGLWPPSSSEPTGGFGLSPAAVTPVGGNGTAARAAAGPGVGSQPLRFSRFVKPRISCFQKLQNRRSQRGRRRSARALGHGWHRWHEWRQREGPGMSTETHGR